MLPSPIIVATSLFYLAMLFAIAFYADRRAGAGASMIDSPTIYSLSLAVYATSWTFYGSVGRAVNSGISFLTIYLGPTLAVLLWWTVLRKIIRISKANHITSLADFIASRYGKSALLGALVTFIAVIGVVPYIALQLKAVSVSFNVLTQYPDSMAERGESVPLWSDTTLYIALLLATFTILFGTRRLDASEHHEGMVAAIAFESLIKLVAFLAVGLYVTFVMYDGFADLFGRANAVPELQRLLTLDSGDGGSTGFGSWLSLMLLSTLSVLMLPRQFQIAVVENVNESHLEKAIWLFPLYLLLINIFVLPIAFAGVLHFPGGVPPADMFVLALPLRDQQRGLALLVFVGGLSAATGMIIVETIALSTMVSNGLVMPLLLRVFSLDLAGRSDLSRMILNIRRATIVLLVLLGYGYFRLAGEAPALVSIGLISFAAVAQFAPSLLGGIFWRTGNLRGAAAGLSAGFVLWMYTLLLPSFAASGWLPAAFLQEGPFGIEWLRPHQLFGLGGLDEISHSLFWSMLANIGAYVGVSLMSSQDEVERTQALMFVEPDARVLRSRLWRGSASGDALNDLLSRFMGEDGAAEAFARFHRSQPLPGASDADLVHFAEMELAGAIGNASARAAVAAVIDEEPLNRDEVMAVLDETAHVVAHSQALERKSRELEAATSELKTANLRLTELDKMKDDFISTVTHELRTPLTAIRAFSEILRDHPQLPEQKRSAYLDIVIKESERLTRLINNVLDMAKIEAGQVEWHDCLLDMKQVIEDAVNATSQLFAEQHVVLDLKLPDSVPLFIADRDRIIQVLLNLLSNAVKFCNQADGRVTVSLEVRDDALRVRVSDNGPGVRPQDKDLIFEKFRQGGDSLAGKPQGTGLGLPISREIIRHFGGALWLESAPGEGATFVFTLPLKKVSEHAA